MAVAIVNVTKSRYGGFASLYRADCGRGSDSKTVLEAEIFKEQDYRRSIHDEKSGLNHVLDIFATEDVII